MRSAILTFVAIVVLGGLLTFLRLQPVYADDIGGVIKAGPSGGWGTITSNTVIVFEFYSRQTPVAPSSDWTTTNTQYFRDATTTTLYRVRAKEWFEVSNFTTYTILMAPNVGWQPISGGNGHWFNETTPTLGPDIYAFRVDPGTSNYPFRVSHTRDAYPQIFPNLGIQNIGLYFLDASGDFYTSAAMRSNVTSRTVVVNVR